MTKRKPNARPKGRPPRFTKELADEVREAWLSAHQPSINWLARQLSVASGTVRAILSHSGAYADAQV